MKQQDPNPPKFANKFLFWFLKKEIVEEVEGDLYEMFFYQLENSNLFRAKMNYWFQVFQYLRRFALRNFQPFSLINSAMYFNYLKIAFRQLLGNKLTYFINTMGLGIALACCICSYLLFAHDFEFDTFHDADKMADVYKIHTHLETKTGIQQERIQVPLAMATEAEGNIPGIEHICRFVSGGFGFVRDGDKAGFSEHISFADTSFFDMFDFPLLSGNHQDFKKKNSIYVSQEVAKKIFGEEDALGKVLTIYFSDEKEVQLTVRGVLAKVPENSSFTFQTLAPFPIYMDVNDIELGNWADRREASTFLKVTADQVVAQLEKGLNQYVSKQNVHLKDSQVKKYQLEQFHAVYDYEQIDRSHVNLRMGILPLIIFGIMAIMILLIACFNLTNTSIAMTTKRLKEIGIRKSIGAKRREIFSQFLVETSLTMVIAVFLGAVFSKYLVAEFREISQFAYGLEDVSGLNLLITLIFIIFLASLIAGIYPALHKSRLNPSNLLRGNVKMRGTHWTNRLLIGSQFTLTVVFMIAGVMFYQNIPFQGNMDYGYAKDEILTVTVHDNQAYERLSNEIRNAPEVLAIGVTNAHIGHYSYAQTIVEIDGEPYDVQALNIGDNYLETMGFSLVEGRFLQSQSSHNQESGILVNQAFLKKTGLEDPFAAPVLYQESKRQIVGVVNDHIDDLDQIDASQPFIFLLAKPEDYRMMVIRTAPEKMAELQAALKTIWQESFPTKNFVSRDQNDVVLGGMQQANLALGEIFLFLTILGIVLSVSGIFALAALNVAKRRKEIGVRKVLGASVQNIISLVNREFITILGISVILGAVCGTLLTDVLLDAIFNFHSPMRGLPVILAAMAVFLAGAITTSSIIFKAASSNPVHSLRQE